MIVPFSGKGKAVPMICHNGICKPALDQAVKNGILNADGSATVATKVLAKMVDFQMRTQDMHHEYFSTRADGQVTIPVDFLIEAGFIDKATGLPTEKANSIISKMSQPAASDGKKCSCKKSIATAEAKKQIEKLVRDVVRKRSKSKGFFGTKPSGVPVERVPRSAVEALGAGRRDGHQHGVDVVNKLWGRSTTEKPSGGIQNNQTIVGKGLFRSTR